EETDDPSREQFLAEVSVPVVIARTKADLGGSVISVVTGQGLAELRRQLAEVAFGRLLALGDVEPVVTRARHRVALERAQRELEEFWTARTSGIDAAAAATHLRAAVVALDDLIGAVTPEDVLDRVFAAFCVGKWARHGPTNFFVVPRRTLAPGLGRQSAVCSMSCASSMSLAVTPPALCVHSFTCTLPQL